MPDPDTCFICGQRKDQHDFSRGLWRAATDGVCQRIGLPPGTRFSTGCAIEYALTQKAETLQDEKDEAGSRPLSPVTTTTDTSASSETPQQAKRTFPYVTSTDVKRKRRDLLEELNGGASLSGGPSVCEETNGAEHGDAGTYKSVADSILNEINPGREAQETSEVSAPSGYDSDGWPWGFDRVGCDGSLQGN